MNRISPFKQALLSIALCLTFVHGAYCQYIKPMQNPISDADRLLLTEVLQSTDGPAIYAEDWLLIISVARQRMVVAQGNAIKKVYTISTAKAGVGSLENSGKTPLGWHQVTEWIGKEALAGQVFVSRKPTSEIIPHTRWSESNSKDKVLTRIMWLSGLEPGRNKGGNVDSHNRFIYLHGTNQEHLLGSPASHGCIRLYNHNVIELFEMTNGSTTYCLIK